MKVVLSKLQEFHANVYVDDIDVQFLKNFEKSQFGKKKSVATVASYMRDVRTVFKLLYSSKEDYSTRLQLSFWQR